MVTTFEFMIFLVAVVAVPLAFFVVVSVVGDFEAFMECSSVDDILLVAPVAISFVAFAAGMVR